MQTIHLRGHARATSRHVVPPTAVPVRPYLPAPLQTRTPAVADPLPACPAVARQSVPAVPLIARRAV
jgi:hypothetical protein